MKSFRPRRRPGDEGEFASRLRTTAHPRFYAAQMTSLSSPLDVDATVDHFLERGLREGARVSALFNEEHYLGRLEERGIAVPEGEHPFLHWLGAGWDQRIVPTPLFDEGHYVASHPELGGGREWPFAQFLRAGCYAPARRPSPFAPNYGTVAVPEARKRQEPVLLAGMLHRAEDYDLRRTSWLEEGVAATTAKLAALDSDRMRSLVAKAAAIEPLVLQPKRERWVSWSPHLHRAELPVPRTEEVRRDIGLTRADTVVLLATTAPSPGADAAGALVDALGAGGEQVVVVRTDPGPSGEQGPGWTGPAAFADLAPGLEGLNEHQQLLCLLDVVRGLGAGRLVVADSALGWRLLTGFSRTLRHELSLGAFVSGWERDEDGDRVGYAVRELQQVFDRLDWVLTDDPALRDDLVARYLLPAASATRIVVASAPADVSVDALRALEEERR